MVAKLNTSRNIELKTGGKKHIFGLMTIAISLDLNQVQRLRVMVRWYEPYVVPVIIYLQRLFDLLKFCLVW